MIVHNISMTPRRRRATGPSVFPVPAPQQASLWDHMTVWVLLACLIGSIAMTLAVAIWITAAS
jgi:hypothetical protein